MERRRQRNGTNGTDGTHGHQEHRVIPPHGGYRNLKSYQAAEIIFDATNAFCERFINPRSRTYDQMVQVARASLQELLEDYQDFLRLRRLPIWPKDHPQALIIRNLAYRTDRTYETYRTYVEDAPPEVAANTLICIIHQANTLLDRQLESLERSFLKEGGFTERLYRTRTEYRRTRPNTPPPRKPGPDESHPSH